MKFGIQDYNTFNNIQNSIFKIGTNQIGENLEYPFIVLKKELEKRGHTIDTLDMHPIEEFDHIIFIDWPNFNEIYFEHLKSLKIRLHLILLESPLIKPENFVLRNHKWFDTVFTWNSKLVDNLKYFKIQIAHKFPESINFNINDKIKFCTIIAGNKRGNKKTELYSERKRVITWFNKYHPNDFDLYGFGWDKYEFHGFRPFRLLNRFSFIGNLLRPRLKFYKGPVSSKFETLKSYKYSFCYENIRDVPDYITEKIFDSFFAGCIPIYLGAPNIDEYIPADCFISKKDFISYKELYNYLKNISNKENEIYLNNIKKFLESPKAEMFKAEAFASVIIKNILRFN